MQIIHLRARPCFFFSKKSKEPNNAWSYIKRDDDLEESTDGIMGVLLHRVSMMPMLLVK